MAHRSLTRTGLAAGLTATLLFAPAAGQALALGGGDLTDDSDSSVDDAAEQTTETVDETVDAVSGGEAEATADEPTAPVDNTVESTTEAVDEAVDGVREVVEKAASGDPGGAAESTANTVEDTTNTVSGVVRDVVDGGAEAEGGEPTEVRDADGSPDDGPADDPEPDRPHRTNSAPRFEPDGGFNDRSASISSGFTRNVGGGNGSASSFEPPATSGVFDPSRGDSSSAPGPDVDSLAEPAGPSNAGVPNPRDIPTSLVLTATALLVLVGAGHVLHAVRRGGLEFG